MATYTFTGQCYSQSGDTKKYESDLWQGVSYTESTVGGVTDTQLTRLDTDPTNYVYTITYLPDNIDNGTVVTVSGSSIYAGVSKSFAFSFTGTKSTIETAYFPIHFVITDSYGEPIQSEFSHGKIAITTGFVKMDYSDKVDYVEGVDLSLSNGNFYGYYECKYNRSNTDEYVCDINDDITIEVNQMFPNTFGTNHYVGFGLVLDGALSDNNLDETITIHSQINSGTWDPGTATLRYAGLLTVQVDITNISEGGLSGQYWTNEIDEYFDSPFIGYIKDTNNLVKAKLRLTFNIVTRT